jgi:hypothetical protein
MHADDYADRPTLHLPACLAGALQVEAGMVASVQETVRKGMAAYPDRPRAQWVLEWPGQVVLAVTAIFWTQVSHALLIVMQLLPARREHRLQPPPRWPGQRMP